MLKKNKIELPSDPAILLLEFYPRELKHMPMQTFTRMFGSSIVYNSLQGKIKCVGGTYKQVKRCSTLALREMQIETTVRYYRPPIVCEAT